MNLRKLVKKDLTNGGSCVLQWVKVGKSGKMRVTRGLDMFFGEFEYKIDEKGRVPFPPKFRNGLKDGVVLTPGVEKCINAYPLSEWKKLAVCNFLARMRFNGFRPE